MITSGFCGQGRVLTTNVTTRSFNTLLCISQLILLLRTSTMAEEIDEEILEELYTWIDDISLSRPKKDLRRDFSDGGKRSSLTLTRTLSLSLTQQTHNVNTTLYNVVILKRCENYIPATLLQRKLQGCATTCTQRCEITL